LIAAAAWERQHRPSDARPIGRLGVEAAFLLAIPLLEMPSTFSGKCRLAVEVQGGSSPIFAGVQVHVETGRVVFCSSRLKGEVEAWASGAPDVWLERMGGAEGYRLELGGDIGVAEAFIDGLAKAITLSRPLEIDPA
jgi:hypothetical protein